MPSPTICLWDASCRARSHGCSRITTRRSSRPISTETAIVLPQRERYAPGEAGAIALLAARLACSEDCILGTATDLPPFAAGRFVPIGGAFPGLSAAARYARGCARIIRRSAPGLIEIHNRPDVALALARASPRTPLLLVLHNDPKGMRKARTPAEREWLARKMRIAVVSTWVRDRFLSGTRLSLGAVDILPNCLDIAVLPPSRPMADRRREILFAGRVVADKGADAFVRACAAVLPLWSGWTARMIGGDRFGASPVRTPFLDRVTPQAEAAGIVMEGYRPHDAVMAAMAEAAIVVVPSRWAEPFGLTALEAMAAGAALIAAPSGGLPDVVGDAALLADPDTPGALEAALDRAIGDEDLRAALSGRGQARALTFDVPAARARLRALRADVRARPAISP